MLRSFFFVVFASLQRQRSKKVPTKNQKKRSKKKAGRTKTPVSRPPSTQLAVLRLQFVARRSAVWCSGDDIVVVVVMVWIHAMLLRASVVLIVEVSDRCP